MAQFLDRAPDVAAFCRDVGRLAHYTSDFLIMQEDLKKRERFFEPDLTSPSSPRPEVCFAPHQDLC